MSEGVAALIPSHGTSYSTFLLAYVGRFGSYESVDHWIGAARRVRSHLASAVELRSPAEHLLRLGLAEWSDGIIVSPRLLPLADVADRSNLFGIAQLLLSLDPPAWFDVAVGGGEVAREYIPVVDLQLLGWLEPHLDSCLLGAKVARERREDDGFKKRLGDAAELYVLAALKSSGWDAIHVSRVSDSYGYDIEARGSRLVQIEVKAGSEKTRGSFHLSRNEFDKSQLLPDSWKLLQVVFLSAAFVVDVVDASHVAGIYELSPETISSIVPEDTVEFHWQESARLSLPEDRWALSALSPDVNFKMPGFRLGRGPLLE